MYEHGIFVSENSTESIASNTGIGVQVVVGVAPINLASEPATANTPVLCRNMAEAKKKLGYCKEFDKFNLCQSMFANFEIYKVSPVIFINVIDPENTSRHKENITAADYELTAKQIKIENKGVLKSTVVVKAKGGTGTAYTVDEDYTVNYDDEGNCIITVLTSGSIPTSATELSVAYSALKPSGVNDNDIVAGLNALTQVFPVTNYVPGLVLAPGYTSVAVSTALQNKVESINDLFTCECLIDLNSSSNGADSYDDIEDVKEAQGLTSPHAYGLWPKVKTLTGEILSYSAVMGALLTSIDADNEGIPNLSPSNKKTPFVAAAVLEDGSEVVLDLEQANAVNEQGITTIFNFNGFRSWGNNTCAFPATSDPKDRWFAVRRFFSFWANSFIINYFDFVDDPANPRLIQTLLDNENIRGNSFVARGICARAEITFSSDENSTESLLAGKIKFHQYLSPYTPAECIKNTLEFDPQALIDAIGGE